MVFLVSRLLKASRITAGIRCLIFITVLAQLTTTGSSQTLPYIPTSIFIPESKPASGEDNVTADVAYIFSPQGDWVDLLALNFSSNLQASSLSLQTLSSNVPFLDSNHTAFTPSLADNGSLIVYAGDCSSPASSEIWTFNPSSNNDDSSSWTKASTSLATGSDTLQLGPGFLGSGFSFSNIIEPNLSPAITYVYGGMCPGMASNISESQSNATYSNQMIKISPSGANTGQFTVSPVSTKGPPVPEAGFTFTGLSPSISNRSTVVTQQVNYVLLGGHTQYAFINMSTVAIWSLPEESWSFISGIEVAGSGSANTELAIKSTIHSIDSRSGHTAVLNEDGTSLIIFGGWVGDLTQAASPQLAILKIGASYGGDGDWQWVVPDTQPSGPGIYGHGAALLPGNIMMVHGGYTISSTGSKARRQSSGASAPMFLNLTSMSWSEQYTNPQYTETGQSSTTTGAVNDAEKRLGLGLGLGLGIVAIIIAISFYIVYRRRLRHRRTIRESAIRALAQDTSRFLPHDDEMMETDHPGPGWYTGGPDPYLRGSRSLGYQSLQTNHGGLDYSQHHHSWFGGMSMPPTQVLRKPIPRRNTYESPSAVIHPIIEADEDGSLHDGDITSEPVSPIRDTNPDGRRDSDPFLTPTQEKLEYPISFPPPSRASQTPSPEDRRRTTDPEVQDWMSDVEAMDALISGRGAAGATRSGQPSPTKRGPGDDSRTESNISESNRSTLAVSRSGSVRSHLRAGFGVAAAALAAAIDEGRGGSSSSSSAPSYNTARSSFPALQAEGPGLLMGRARGGDRDRDRDDDGMPGSPSKSKPRRSWLGSLRRVFSGSTPSQSPPESPDKDDVFAEGGDFDMRLGGLSGIAAGGLLRRKSGRGDWEALEQGPGRGQGTRGVGRGKGKGVAGSAREEQTAAEDDDDDEWDIEKAVERRLVQVMFTVPREPLRVVNAEPDVESGKDVVLVDPKEGGTTEEERTTGKKPQVEEEIEERDLGVPIQSPSPVSEEDRESGGHDAEKDILREVQDELDAEWVLYRGRHREGNRDQERGRQPATPVRRTPTLQEEGVRLLGVDLPSTESRKRKPSRSPVEDPEGDVFSAQAVKLERPRTRVLAMVESIESLSRENSPSGSPSR
ncbi:hypothetical protein M434DRAFT_395992 [Hypoxylon sp. CO27-5]|nr:hypothetical protein M434DRAFT_395992 [Hypoxylon sp. CO27-5]